MKSLPKSFVTLMAGWGFWVLAALYIVVDLKKWWTGSPFNVVGMNSILLYILHETLADQIPFCGGCGHVNDSHEIRMAMNVGAVTVWVLYAYYIGVGNFRNLFTNQALAINLLQLISNPPILSLQAVLFGRLIGANSFTVSVLIKRLNIS